MKIENLTEAKRILNVVRNFLIETNDDEVYNAMHQDLFRAVTDAMFLTDRVEKFDTKRKETNEMYMKKVVYKRSEYDNRFYLHLENVFSINEFTHNYHIYEVTTKRMYNDDEYKYTLENFDFINKILVLCDFDMRSCCNKDTVEEFEEEITDLAIDLMFDNVEYNLKQIS